MDLHIVGAEPTAEERAAVDALLGPPESGWAGGRRDSAQDGRMSRAGLEEVRDRRDLLLPAFHAVQDRIGWVSRGALNYICKRLIVPPAEAWGVLTFYHLFKTEPTPRVIAHVCDDIACRLNGAEQICAALDEQIAWQRSPCLGQCDRPVAALIIRAGDAPSTQTVVGVSNAREVVDAVRDNKAPVARALPGPQRAVFARRAPRAAARAWDPRWGGFRPAGDKEPRIVGTKLLRRIGSVDPVSLESYQAHGGYQALTRAMTIGGSAVIAEVTASNLLGRGGAAFPTGRKWEAVAREQAKPHFLVCNADESEPGTFKDRVLLEEDPFAIVEAMTIAAFATGCAHGFIYLRGEYPLAHARVQAAIDAARQAQLLGGNILESQFRFDLEIRRGAGAYICGEETALFNSLEGKRGEPRSKPPFPAQVGLFGKPTVVNNVETLINVIDIVLEGGAEWARVGTKESTGTRLFCLSGNVAKPGLYELAFGVTLGELLSLAGGVADNRPLQAILLGGAAGTFVAPDALSLRLTFEDVRVAGATLGSGVVMVFDDRADLADTLLRIARFMEDESCGQCVPCRVGTVRQVEILKRLQRSSRSGADLVVPARTDADIALLRELGQCMRDASICGLGQTASSAVETAIARLHLFRHAEGTP